MNANQVMDDIFPSEEFRVRATYIAAELANRGMSPGHDFHRFVKKDSDLEFTRVCTAFHSKVFLVLQQENNVYKIMNADNGAVWLNMLRFFVKDENDVDSIALNVCVALIQQHSIDLDGQVESLSSRQLLEKLGIEPDGEMLVDLSDKRLALKRQAIIFDDKYAVYPHQFLRRYYRANFVDTLNILAYACKGASVSVRIDPLRITEAKNYVIDGIFEADRWHGPKFSKQLMQERYKSSRTVHRSSGVVNHHYFADFTVFRTKMMDTGQREISIEEYCPLETPSGHISPGWGSKYFIQKFGHLIYDQTKETFVHVDGAVRVFKVDEYAEYFDIIESGRDNPDHIGKRHKMFLVENPSGVKIDLIEALLAAWFRYNPHIQEYFSGTKAENEIPLEVIKAARTGRLKSDPHQSE